MKIFSIIFCHYHSVRDFFFFFTRIYTNQTLKPVFDASNIWSPAWQICDLVTWVLQFCNKFYMMLNVYRAVHSI